MTIQYDGTSYSGWQVQNGRGKRTVQGEIEKVLEKIFQEKVRLIGASRTDAGVHALGQVENFTTAKKITSLKKLQRSLNSMLSRDIVISALTRAKEDFHSRFDAKDKTYCYYILNQPYPSVTKRHYAWHIPYELDWNKMEKEARYFKGRHDFSPFSCAGSSRRNTFPTVREFTIRKKGNLHTIRIRADFFLYKMVRAMVGHLVEVGKGSSASRPALAPARGLVLVKVRYR